LRPHVNMTSVLDGSSVLRPHVDMTSTLDGCRMERECQFAL
jgi:hypothetical protein